MQQSKIKNNFIKPYTFLLNLEPLKLLNNKTIVEEFYNNGLYTNTTLKDSMFNLNDLIDFYTSEEEVIENTKEDEQPFQHKTSNINLCFQNKKANS